MRQLVLDQFYAQETNRFAQMIGQYEIKSNERNIISLTQSNDAIMPQAANGLNLMNSLTADTKTGSTYRIQDLFKEGRNYREVVSAHVRRQLKERGMTRFDEHVTIK